METVVKHSDDVTMFSVDTASLASRVKGREIESLDLKAGNDAIVERGREGREGRRDFVHERPGDQKTD